MRRVLLACAAIYLGGIFLGSAGFSLPDKVLPRPVRYFTQIACLFPRAATHTIEYRATAFACDEGVFTELDHRPHFPIRPDDKENRFERLGFFHRRDKRVMKELDAYLVDRHNERVARGEAPGDGIDGRIGGILLMSLRIPLPEAGAELEPYRRVPLAEIPNSWKKYWYKTPRPRLEERCQPEEGP